MKKILFLFLVLGMVSCRHDEPKPNVEVTWIVQVDYLDGVRDTLELTTNDIEEEPHLYAGREVSTLDLGWKTKAAYVKSFKVLGKTMK